MNRPVTILISVGAGFLLLAAGTAAGAATGGNFILGKANSETSTASLSDSKGTPLKLSAPAGVAPLAVSGNALVANLDSFLVLGHNYYIYLKPFDVADDVVLKRMRFSGKPPVWIPMPPH